MHNALAGMSGGEAHAASCWRLSAGSASPTSLACASKVSSSLAAAEGANQSAGVALPSSDSDSRAASSAMASLISPTRGFATRLRICTLQTGPERYRPFAH